MKCKSKYVIPLTLILAQLGPGPAFALRSLSSSENSGLEEQISKRLQRSGSSSATGMEEKFKTPRETLLFLMENGTTDSYPNSVNKLGNKGDFWMPKVIL